MDIYCTATALFKINTIFKPTSELRRKLASVGVYNIFTY